MPPGVRGLLAQRDGNSVILIDRSLPPAERLAVLAHELAHIDRGGSGWEPGIPASLGVVVEREERRVDDLVARRLVPRGDLAEYVAAMVDLGEPVTAASTADRFEVSVDVAQRALELHARAG